jgi:hypothetical protein
MKLKLLESEELIDVSGIVKYGRQYIVIGDDSPYLFLSQNFEIDSRIQIFASNRLVGGESIPKSHKPEFEAMPMIDENRLPVFCIGIEVT